MSSIAYGLRADYDGTVTIDGEERPRFTGSIGLGDGRALDLREALDAGDGRIIVEDTDYALVNELEAHEALKRVPVGDADTAVRTIDTAGIAELRAEAEVRGLATGGSKAELRDRILAHDQAVAAGDAETAADARPEA